MSSAKKPKKLLFGKTFNKKFVTPPSEKKKASPAKNQSAGCAAIDDDADLKAHPSEIFAADLVRMSLISAEGVETYSFDGVSEGDSNNEDDSMSIYTEEEDKDKAEPKERWNQRYAPRTPREVAIGNKACGDGDDSSSDNDDMYLEDENEEEEKPKNVEIVWAPPEDDDSVESLERIDSLTALPSNCSRFVPEEETLAMQTPSARPRGVLTQSIVDYTRKSSFGASIRVIDSMLHESEEQSRRRLLVSNDEEFSGEDSASLLAQMNSALSIRQIDETDVKEADELESELYDAELETDKLAQQLDAVEAKNEAMKGELSSQKVDIKNIAERGEQVHLERRFAPQSKRDFKYESDRLLKSKVPRQNAARNMNYASDDRKTSMEPTIEAFGEDEGSDGGSDEENSDVNAAESLKDNSDEMEEGGSMNVIETVEGDEEDTGKQVLDVNDIKTLDDNEALDGSEGAAALETGASIAYSSDEEGDTTEYNYILTPEFTAVDEQAPIVEIDSMLASGDTMTAEDDVKLKKLRGSMVWAKRMSSRGDAFRENPSYEVGEVEGEEDIITGEEEFINVHDDLRKSSQLATIQMAEVTELRARLQEQQEEIEGLEHERDFNASKVGELMAVMSMSNKSDDINELGEHLANKSVEVAELNYELNYLKDRLAQAENKSNTLEAEQDANKVVIANLSESLWNDSSPKKNSTEHAAQDLIKQGGVIPKDHAMEMTIANLQKKMEKLEEEKGEFTVTIKSLTASVTELTQENDARKLKIEALESQFLSLNQRQVAPSVATANKSPEKGQEGETVSGFKAWANSKINQAQEQYETIKDEFEIRRSNTNPDQILTIT